MFEFNNEEFTLEQIQSAAAQSNMTVDDYIKQHEIKELGKTTPTSPGADVEENAAPELTVTESPSVDISLESPQTGTVDSTLITQEEIDRKAAEDAAAEERVASLSAKESLSNAFSTLKLDASRVGEFYSGESASLDIASSAIAQGVFGKDVVDAYVAKYGEDSFLTEGLGSNELLEAIPEYKKQQERRKETLPIIESFKQGEIVKGFSAMLGAGINALGSIIYGGGTFGSGYFMDFLAENYVDYNEGKAKRLGVKLDTLIKEDKADLGAPIAIAGVQSALEFFAFGKMTGALTNSMGNAATKAIVADILAASESEAITEMLQFGATAANQKLGETGSKTQAAFEFISAISSQEGIESGLQGFLGGGGIKGSRYALRSVSNLRAPVDQEAIEKDVQEYSNLNQQLQNAKDDTVKEGIQKSIDEIKERLNGRITKSNSILPNFSNKDIDDITNMNELAKLQVQRVKTLNKKLDDGQISTKEHNTALEGFKKTYIEAKNRIKGVKERVEDRSSKEAKKVNEIYDEKGKEGIAEILELYKPMAKRIASKYRMVPGFDMELITDEILTGKRGILDLINAYDPDTKVPLAAYVNKFASTRGIEAAQRILKETFEADVTEAKGVTDTVEADTQIEIKQEAQQEVKKALAQDLNLSENTQNEIVTAVEKTLGTKLPAVTDKGFKPALTKGFRTELTNSLKKVFGRTASYEQFLRDNFEKIYPAIPQETINKKFKEFNEAVVDPETGKQLRERTAEGKKVFKKRDIAKAEFIKYFLDAPGNVKGARKTSLAEVIADEVGLDNVLGVLAKPEVVEKFKAIQELQGQEVPSNFIEIISEKIDRAINYLDNLQKNNDTLYVSLVVPELAIAVAKTFLKAFKLAFKATGNFAKAFKKAIEEAKKLLPNKEEQQALEDAAKNTFKKAEDIGDIPTNEKFVKNLDTAISEVRAKKIVDNKIAELQKTKNVGDVLNFMRYIGDPLKNGGFVVGNNSKELFEFIKNQNVLSKEDLKRFKVTGKVNFTIYFDGKKIRELYPKSNPKTMTGKSGYFAKDSNFSEYIKENLDNFDNQADYNKRVVLEEITKLTFKGRKEDAKNLLQLWGSNTASDTPLRMMGKLRSYQTGVKEVTYEHTPPIATLREQLEKLIDNHKEGDSALEFTNAVKKVLDKSFVDLVQSRKKGKDVIPKTGNTVERYSSILDVNNDLIYFRDAPTKPSLDKQFNQLLQATTKVDWTKEFSPVKAKLLGRGKGKKFFIPYSADDFVGLLYATIGKGEVGNKQMAWYNENLIRPFSRAIQQFENAKQNSLRKWMDLKKQAIKDVPGKLNKENDSGFTNQDSARIYIWKSQGMEIPGLENDPQTVSENLDIVKNNPKLKEFADRLKALNSEGYPPPSADWSAGDITTDLVSYVNDVKRSEYLTEWKENVKEIFNDRNKNKLKALYGDRYVEALDDILIRMSTGRNRRSAASKAEKAFMDWTNNSIGTIMFFNARSAVLQTLSAVNFINFSDNNPINAGLALANFPQYVKDFTALFNSDFLKQRRSGLQTDVNADEIANAAATSQNKAKAMLSYILKIGFAPTQIADSFAIASGGATFYRNRIKKYLKEGLSKEEAESKAFTDFQEIAEETQQSARPDRISSQQAGSLGRLILAFGNTPMQYARLTKKAALDLINGRGDWKTNISKIAYYSVIQNIIFSALQQGLFALLFDDEDDEETQSRLFRIGNSSFDTLLRGTGVYGAAAATVKNMILEIIEQSKKKRPDYTQVAIESTAISPPINSKLRKLISAGKTFTYKQTKEKVFTEGFSLENPAFMAAGQVISAGTNLPADRIVKKADHLYIAMQAETELWQSIALSLGWSKWDLNMIEKQTKKSAKPKTTFKTKSFQKGFKRKKFKTN